jgi:hypothetical protein
MSPTSTLSQGHHAPKTNSSGHSGVRRIGLKVATRRTASWQPSEAYNHRFAIVAGLRFKLAEACEVKRRHANKVKLRLNTGATGHDEGSEIGIRSVNSCPRAPRLNKRNWIVSRVAQAHEVVFNTARRKVSSKTEAAECKNNLNGLASKR